MNINLFSNNWSKYYRRGFLLSFFIISILCVVDQTLDNPFFFSPIDNLTIFFITLTTVFFASVFCGLLNLIFLLLISFFEKK